MKKDVCAPQENKQTFLTTQKTTMRTWVYLGDFIQITQAAEWLEPPGRNQYKAVAPPPSIEPHGIQNVKSPKVHMIKL